MDNFFTYKKYRDKKDKDEARAYALGVCFWGSLILMVPVSECVSDYKYNKLREMNQKFNYEIDYLNDDYINLKKDYLHDAWFDEFAFREDSVREVGDLEQKIGR